jgi:hypothetical protein
LHKWQRQYCTAALLVVLPAALATVATASPRGSEPTLPAGTLRGPASRLQQYPTLALATPVQRTAAKRLLAATRAATAKWRNPRVAAAAGFNTRTRTRRPGDRTVHYLHAENREFYNDNSHVDPRRPETIIYANAPGAPLVLVGVMLNVPRGVHGPTPGGPITRWHTHRVCARGKKRGVTPRRDGSCPLGTKPRQGSEMLHIWFTGDLRSAYAIHAPEPELCTARVLPAEACGQTAPHHHH